MQKSRGLWKFILAAFGLLLWAHASFAAATLLPNGKQQFFNGSGVPLAGGSVSFFAPGTSTPQNTWMDSGQTQLNSNPVVLDGNGMALIYGLGTYREVVQDSVGNTIWDTLTNQYAASTDMQNGSYIWGGTATGASNTFNISVSPALTIYQAGQGFRFISNQNITGASQLNINSLGGKSITKFGATAVASGDIINSQIIYVIFDGTQFQMVSAPGTIPTGNGVGVQTAGGVFSIDPSYMRGYLAGMTLADDPTTPATVLDITQGVTTSDDATTLMKVASNFTKTTGSWVVGSGSGCLDAGTVQASTWYFVFAIERIDTLNVDYLCSNSLASPALPTNYTKKRRIGQIVTDGGSSIIAFVQLGDEFIWKASVNQVNIATLTTARTLVGPLNNIPPGIQVNVEARIEVSNAAANTLVILTSPDENDQAPLGSAAGVDLQTAVAANAVAGRFNIRSNIAQQIGARSSAASTTIQVTPYGYIDTRGRFN